MSAKQKKNLIRIIVSLVLFVIVFVIDLTVHLDTVISNQRIAWFLPFGLFFAVYMLIGYDVLWRAVKNISRGQVFDENFLMCIATVGAFAISDFAEGVAVLLFYQVGEWFQSYAVGKSRKSISALMDIRPDFANVRREDGSFEEVDPSEVNVDDIILIKPGERIPLDGVIMSGTSTIDTKALTGESLPQDVGINASVISGTVNLTGTLEVRVEKAFYDSTVSKILDLVENASSKKSKSENFISRFAKWYTPTVVIGAALLAVAGGAISGEWMDWLSRALNFLVVSCPCALVISIPLSFFAGIGGASRHGILIKGSSYLERFNKANVFVFDKTGTLTKGNFAVTEISPDSRREQILRYASIAESNSNHPIALSIKQAYAGDVDTSYEVTDIAGKGIIAKGVDEVILCGNEKLMQEYNIQYVESQGIGTIVYVAVNNEFVGSIVIADEVKPEAKEMISYLNSIGAKTIMLTGDNPRIAEHVARQLGLTEFKASLLPQNKVEEVDKLLMEKADNELLCFVGDGINDAPVLVKSDIGISMGGVGSDAAIEASDIVLMHDDLRCISIAKKIARKTLRIVHENIYFALGVKALVLILSAVGLANMWLAILADVGVSVVAILNSMRTNSKYD